MWIHLPVMIILTAIAWQDGMSHRIPDYMIALLLVCGLARSLLEGQPLNSLVGFLLCGYPALTLAVSLRHGSIGGGDVKLCAALGSLLGPLDGILTILIALAGLSIYGISKRKAGAPIPYAPFVLPAYIAVIFLQEGLI